MCIVEHLLEHVTVFGCNSRRIAGIARSSTTQYFFMADSITPLYQSCNPLPYVLSSRIIPLRRNGMPTLDYANDCDVCGADRRFCDCQQGRTSLFSGSYDPADRWLLGVDHLCVERECVPLLCWQTCPCKCHRDSTRECRRRLPHRGFQKGGVQWIGPKDSRKR